MATRKASVAKAQAKRTPEPESSPQCYRARVYHEIKLSDGGVKRVEPGMIVAQEEDGLAVYTPEQWGDAPVSDQE